MLYKKRLLRGGYILSMCAVLVSCYKLENTSIDYNDNQSILIKDMPGDTLASDGWGESYDKGDTYIRMRSYTSIWSDSIRFIPYGTELINSAKNVGEQSEKTIIWLSDQRVHPTKPEDNNAYKNSDDGLNYIFRDGAWYRMNITGFEESNNQSDVNIDWRGYLKVAPINAKVGWTYCDLDNQRIYRYDGKAWSLLVSNANYRENKSFIQVQYSKSGKETGKHNIFTFRFSDGKQQFIRDAVDSLRYLPNYDWDIAFTEQYNSTVWVNNGQYEFNPGFKGPVKKSSVLMYPYGYEFMKEAPTDEEFDAVLPLDRRMSELSEYGGGENAWYQYSYTTNIANPFPYRAFYLRLEQADGSFLYGKLQLISMYKGAPEVLTDRNWPSPYLTFRYFIQKDGSRNVQTTN